MRGPLGALPALSPAARRAVVGCGLLAAGNAVALAAAAWALAGVLAAVVAGTPFSGLLAVFVAAVLVRALLGWAGQTVAARAAAGAKEDLRAHLLDAALRRGPEWIDERHPAELTTLATTGLDALDDYFTRFLPALVGAAVTVPLAGLVILLADWQSAVIIAVTVPLVPLFAALVGRFTQGRVAAAADASGRLAAHLLELVRALSVLTAFGRADAQTGAVRAESERHRVATRTTLRVAFLSAFALDVIATLSVALVAVDVGLRLLAGEVGLSTALLVLILAPECYLPLRAAGAAFHASEDGLEAAARVATIVGAEGHPVPKGVRPDGLRHQLDITGLRVRRRDGDAPAGLTVRVRPGEITRLDSPSGTGKSTTFAVLLGFVPPTAGTVTVDGADLSTLDMEEWRRHVAWVPQRPRFTAPTVEAELRLAAPDADPATVAGTLLHRGIDTLSSGERQRVALFRALLRLRQGAWLLLLDEPTAHLDHATAAQVTALIDEAAASGAAVLLATHTGLVHEPLSEQQPTAVAVGVDRPTAPAVRLRELVSPRLLAGALLGALASGSAVALTATAAWLITRAAAHPSIVVLTVAVIAVRAFGLGKGVLRYAERLVSHDAAFRLAGRLRVRLWSALVRLGPVRAARLADGQRRLVSDVDTVRDLVPRVLTPPLTALLVGAGAVALETALYPPAGLALCVALLVAGLAGPLAGLAAERRATRILAGGRRDVAGAVLALLDAAADLLATGTHRVRRTELARMDARLAATARRQAWGAGVTTAIAIAALGTATVLATWLSAGHVNPVSTAVLALVPLALAETVDSLGPALRHLDPLRAAYGRITELDVPVPSWSTPDGPVDLADVSVTWPGATEPALRDVTLTLPPGEETAVLGPSGAGKSTLLALLLGFLRPTGRATIPATVAWCPPEPHLSATTVRENLRLGDPTADDDTLRAALRTVALDDWNLDTRLGPTGAGVSGGEAQRLSLARTLLRARHADLVLLDEPTAHLDTTTARRVLTSIRTELAGRTIVHVTHRPDDAQAATMVLRVTAGRVSTTTPEAVPA
ncbi:MAG TPA: thiol reductant ABC exporter subunit CydD [Pseudonocardiaceae bacterium]|nr:thiol reductant ABC exporter subunit CydD [Pseudonocardiaceae bacterium]